MYIKSLVMHGFKSFPRKTELPFNQGINVILGPNGSGKSNVSDALCFVLGRLSSKSMRATKTSNLIFLGSKSASPSKEAIVEVVFDNIDRTFSVDTDEVSIKRMVRRNGLSLYKINNETKTRQDVLGLLAQAGVDPNGFNIILQGEIQNFVNMHTEERRKIIEEVSGIAVYESRKEKSLRELDRTDDKLKEVNAILKERTSYLNNLEKERQQALKYKKLEEDIRKFKASIIYSDLQKTKKESERVFEEISKKNKEMEKIRKTISSLRASIENYESNIASINSQIQKSTGLEQERLNQEIANIRAGIAGTTVKVENYESKLAEIQRQKKELEETIKSGESSLKDLKKPGSIKGVQERDLELKKKELEILEEQRKKFYTAKSELKSIRERIEDKKNLLLSYSNESDFIIKQTKSISSELFDKNSSKQKVESLKIALAEKKDLLDSFSLRLKELEKTTSTKEYEIDKQKKLIDNISKMDVCPICKSKITESHIDHINKDTSEKISILRKEVEDADKELTEICSKNELVRHEIEQTSVEISKREADLVKLYSIEEKKNQIKNLYEKTEVLKAEISELEKIKKKLEDYFEGNANIEQKYETAKMEFQEISVRSQENVDSEISFKQRELERSKISLKQALREEEEIKQELNEIREDLESNEDILAKKRKQEEDLTKKFHALISERDGFHSKIRETELLISQNQNSLYNLEQQVNNFKIEKARFDAMVENLEVEMLGFQNIEIIKTNRESLVEKLAKSQEIISGIGSVNMRALEVYDSVKKEYDIISEKVVVIEKEKNSILKIIHEIDIKKKKTFLKTLDSLNDSFSRNFSQLSIKGQVLLELENRKEPFEGGVNIIVKTGHGKYFDVKSLSGGEQTLVALSLIFAIQELKPYPFYILDEIDAALDKRNSQRLAELLKKYMQKGQYVVISHNDEVISNATTLYGVSMHEGMSKITSLKL